MKKLFLVILILGWSGAANASYTEPACQIYTICYNASGSTPSSCKQDNNTACTQCNARSPVTSTNSSTHVITTDRYGWKATCGSSGEWISCSCQIVSSTYACASGYYGSPTSSTSTACKACVANATCPGGTSFVCNRGYYKNGDACSRCPNTPSTWSPTVTGTTSSTGATANTECYIPSGNKFTDDVGSFELTGNCQYVDHAASIGGSVTVDPGVVVNPGTGEVVMP